MARIKNDSSPEFSSSGMRKVKSSTDYLKEQLGAVDSGIVSILIDMLEMSINKQNPFSTSIEGEFEDRLMEIYGYDECNLWVRDQYNSIHSYIGYVKKGEKAPEETIDWKDYVKYNKKYIIEIENQKLMLRVISWLNKVFPNDDSN